MNNNVAEINDPVKVIKHVEEKFLSVNSNMEYKKESLFAMQALQKNTGLMETAVKNPTSLRNSMLNIAAIGISLNPALHDAYLVPRDGHVCLDISYKGLIKIATESGAIKWVKAELVFDQDEFTYNGPASKPEHRCDPFIKDRGNIKGVYCIAKTKEDDILVEVMSAEDLMVIKKSSPAYKAGSGPWVNFEGEMSKKAVIKRASKTWPRVEIDNRLREAIDMLNESEGYEFGEVEKTAPEIVQPSQDQKSYFDGLIEANDSLSMYVFSQNLHKNDASSQGASIWASLVNSFARGEKGKYKAFVDDMVKRGHVIFYDYIIAIEESLGVDDDHVKSLLSEVDENTVNMIGENIKPEYVSHFIKVIDGAENE